MIDVREDQGKGPPLALESGVILGNFVIERPAVRDPRQRVDPRLGVLGLDHPRLFLELRLRGGELLLHLPVALDELCHRVDHRFRPGRLRGRQFVVDLLHAVVVLADVQGHGRSQRIQLCDNLLEVAQPDVAVPLIDLPAENAAQPPSGDSTRAQEKYGEDQIDYERHRHRSLLLCTQAAR